MTHQQIIERESTNTDSIWLYLEGTFYRAYEQSAFAFHTRVKEYKILRKESKTLGRDILYLGFNEKTLAAVTSDLMTERIDERTVRVRLSTPIDSEEFVQWRDAQELALASQALITPYTKVIEKAPVYKTAYDALSQVILVSRNISRQCQAPFGTRLKQLAYKSCFRVRQLCPSRHSFNLQTRCSRIFSRPIILPARTNAIHTPNCDSRRISLKTSSPSTKKSETAHTAPGALAH